MSKIQSFTITGSDAKRLADRDGLTLRHEGETPFVLVTADGWWSGRRVSELYGYTVEAYFNTSGMYLGPDDDGIEPTWDDAAN